MAASTRSLEENGTPVAFLVFNRPDCTRRTFAAIREARPKRLLVVADGPRPDRPGEAERCAETRTIIADGVDWPCEVETQYSETNLGCRTRVSSGLDWVFTRAAEAIILEDDCLPHPSFFTYCEDLLATYRDDSRVMMIAGANLNPLSGENPYSYRFSRISHVWGWASWRRAWDHYDVDMARWPEFRDMHRLRDVFPDPDMAAHWHQAIENVYRREVDTWDYQLNFASFTQNGVSIVPQTGLIRNIGFSMDATHTTDAGHQHANLVATEMRFPLRHPPFMLADTVADKQAVCPAVLNGWKQKIKRFLRSGR